MLERLLSKMSPNAPRWVVGPFFAASFVLAFAVHRGALIGVPLITLAVLILSDDPWRILGTMGLLYGVVLVAAVLSGVVFAAVGHWLMRIPRIGTFVAFSVSALPYTLALGYVITFAKGAPWRAPPSEAHRFAAGFTALLFGGMAAWAEQSVDKESDNGEGDEDAEQ